MTEQWQTAITEIKPNSVRVRGYDIAEMMGRLSFGGAVYLLLRGEAPTQAVARLMDAILVSSIDHGATPPSVLAARTVASTGAALSAGVAAGVASINRHHGGAIEDCARELMAVVKGAGSGDLGGAAAKRLDEMSAAGKRMPGFGHRIHTADPRTARLFELANEADAAGKHVQAARAVEQVFASRGKPLPINVDGAIAAVLADMGFEPAIMNGLFMIARTPGLVAHVAEEQSRMKPMRVIDPAGQAYDGPAARRLEQGA